LGSRLEELRDILEAASDLPIGVCWDTAHAFASGYDLRTPEGLEATLWETERLIGWLRIPVIHVNDSKAPLGSRVDRHQHIGRGRIGREAFRRLLSHPALAGKSFILETPIERKGDDQRNLRTLRKLAGQSLTMHVSRSSERSA
jgi:deoxyribonuclease-4